MGTWDVGPFDIGGAAGGSGRAEPSSHERVTAGVGRLREAPGRAA